MTKIRITELEKTSDYIDREWGSVLTRRHFLLSSSDWTQLPDTNQSLTTRLLWQKWRHDVRSVKRSKMTLEEATAALDRLEEEVPKSDSTNLDESTELGSLKRNLIDTLAELALRIGAATSAEEVLEVFKNSPIASRD